MKKWISLTLCLCTVLLFIPLSLASPNVQALNSPLKSSLSYYTENGISYTSTQLMSFDGVGSSWTALPGAAADTSSKQEGSASLSMTTASSVSSVSVMLDTKTAAPFDLSITDKRRQTLTMWVYVSDVDLLACDHDSVYDTPQDNCGTFWIRVGNSTGNGYHNWQHTFYGSGWHKIELAFNCHNNDYSTYLNTDYSSLDYIWIAGIYSAGLTVKFDDLRLVTYSNDGYETPVANTNGQWLSTCDAESLDGGILTEWFGCDFDTTRKTQGSSSFKVTGHKEHVDFRACFGGFSVPVDYDQSVFCFDVYVEDLALLGSDWQFRLEEFGPTVAYYSFNFAEVNHYANNGFGITTGWNTVRIPVYAMKLNNGTAYRDSNYKDLTVTFMTAFIAGTSETVDYTVWYDNIYFTTLSAVGLPSAPTGEMGDTLLDSSLESWTGGFWNTQNYIKGSASRQTTLISTGASPITKVLDTPVSLQKDDTVALWFYVSDASRLGSLQIELGSSTSYTPGCARYQWTKNANGYGTSSFVNGWNRITITVPESGPTAAGVIENGYKLYLGSSQTDDMAPDWSSIKYIRIYATASSASITNPLVVAYNGLSFNKRFVVSSDESLISGIGSWDTSNYRAGYASYSEDFTSTGTKAMLTMSLPTTSVDSSDSFGMWVYISDVSKVREMFIEFSSSGNYTPGCARYLFSATISGAQPANTFVNGWNYITLDVPSSGPTVAGVVENGYKLYLGSSQTDDMAPDWSSINYFRVCVNPASGTTASAPLTVKINGLCVE